MNILASLSSWFSGVGQGFGELDLFVARQAEILQGIRSLSQGITALQLQGASMSAELDRLSAEVSENATVTGSAIALLNNLSAQIRALANDPVALAALADSLDANSNALAEAVTLNTPAAPPAEEAPADPV
jgi:uncharacterized coiled-coil protein SlyX